MPSAATTVYVSLWGTKHPVLQLLTVEEVLSWKRVDLPAFRQTDRTFKAAPKVTANVAVEVQSLLGGIDVAAENDEEGEAPVRREGKSKRAARSRKRT